MKYKEKMRKESEAMLIVNYHILTMQEQCRIRKNKSLKEIKFNSEHVIQLATLVPAHKPSIKHVHLQPLAKGRTHQTLSNPRKVDIKLDFTQPVPPIVSKTNNDKENRPASMNQLKHPSLSKPAQTFYNTQKFDSLGVFLPLHEIHEQQEDPQCQKQSLKPILKTHSRTRLLKIAHKEKVKTEMEHQHNDHQPHKTFRKGIIEHIFNRRRQEKEEKTDRNDILAESRIPENEWQESPIIRKNDIFQAQCSTIKEKDENNSSFISKGILGELINEPAPFWLDRSNADRRRKVEVDKFRKKFPDNFFK